MREMLHDAQNTPQVYAPEIEPEIESFVELMRNKHECLPEFKIDIYFIIHFIFRSVDL